MKKFSNVTDLEVEKPMKNWMAQASVRIKKIAEKNGSTAELVDEVNETNINDT